MAVRGVQDVHPARGGPSCGDPAHRPWTTSGGYQVGRPCQGVCPPGLSQSKPLTPRAERRRFRRSVVTAISCGQLTLPHEAAGRLRARRSARPCTSGLPDVQQRPCTSGLSDVQQRPCTSHVCDVQNEERATDFGLKACPAPQTIRAAKRWLIHCREDHACRSASIGSRREARSAGYQPKNTPTSPEKATASSTDSGWMSSGQPAALEMM